MFDQQALIQAFGAFFAIMNPFVNLPIFLGLTSDLTVDEQRALAIRISLLSSLMTVLVFFTGQQVISFFGITIDQFRIAGALVLGSISWSMLNGQSVSSHHGSEKEKRQMVDLDSLAFYPMTFPMIVGPGTVTVLIIYAGSAQTAAENAMILFIISIVMLSLFLVLYFASWFSLVLSQTMRTIMTRFMGMIVLAISIGMLSEGLHAVWQSYQP